VGIADSDVRLPVADEAANFDIIPGGDRDVSAQNIEDDVLIGSDHDDVAVRGDLPCEGSVCDAVPLVGVQRHVTPVRGGDDGLLALDGKSQPFGGVGAKCAEEEKRHADAW